MWKQRFREVKELGQSLVAIKWKSWVWAQASQLPRCCPEPTLMPGVMPSSDPSGFQLICQQCVLLWVTENLLTKGVTGKYCVCSISMVSICPPESWCSKISHPGPWPRVQRLPPFWILRTLKFMWDSLAAEKGKNVLDLLFCFFS
jgi:hypothetical protein